MFGWISKIFTSTKPKVKNQEPTEDALHIYSLKERNIYEYFDGEKYVLADPMVLFKKIKSVGAELDVDIKLSISAHSEALIGHGNIVKKTREIFNIKPLEEGGLTETETNDLLYHFLNYCDNVKKNLS